MREPASPERPGEKGLDPEFDPGLDLDLLRRRRELALTFLALLLVAITSVTVARKMLVTPTPQPSEIIAVAREAVREQAPRGFAVHFGGTQSGEEKLELVQRSEDTYEVSGRVANISPAGRPLFYFFRCLVRRDQAGRVRPEKLDLIPAEY